MSESETFNNQYNTSIKDIAGLKDYSLVFSIINSYFDEPKSSEKKVTEDNEFNIRTSKTRSKVNWAINKSVLQFINKEHKDLVSNAFHEDIPLQDKKFAFLWHICLTNRLCRELTTKVFAKVYFSGRAQISQDDIIAFLKEQIAGDNKDIPQWSEDTLYRVATKYLSLMTKFDFVTAGRIKTFNHIRPSPAAMVLFLYFAQLHDSKTTNILINELLPASFTIKDDIHDRLKKLSLKGYFDMTFNGVTLNIQLKHTYKDICDALYS